jgi:hypothetical protein
VPVPPLYPTIIPDDETGELPRAPILPSSDLVTAFNTAPLPAPDADVSIPTMDKDMLRGMGQLLRNSSRLRPPISRAHAANLGPSVLTAPGDVPTHPEHSSPTESSRPSLPIDRVLHTRSKRAPAQPSSQLGPAPKRSVKDRWYYEPVPSLHGISILPSVPSLLVVPDTPASIPPLVPRAAWMLDGDTRSDAQADTDLHQTNTSLFVSGELLHAQLHVAPMPAFGELASEELLHGQLDAASVPEFGELATPPSPEGDPIIPTSSPVA